MVSQSLTTPFPAVISVHMIYWHTLAFDLLFYQATIYNVAHAQILTVQNTPDIHTRLFRSTHHSVCFSSSSLAIGYDTNIIPINTGSDDWLGILKDLHRNINME